MMTRMSRAPTARRSLPIALGVTVLSTVCAAAFPAGGTSAALSAAEIIQYRGDNPRCDTFYGAFPCGPSEWGSCADDYRSVFPCSSPRSGRRGRI